MGQSATAYQQLWRIVGGAVADAFNRHPDYLTPKGKRSAATSIVKRVTGTVLSFAVAETARSRVTAADKGAGAASSTPEADGVTRVIRTHSCAHVNEVAYQAIRRALFPVSSREVRRDAKRFRSARDAVSKRLRHELQADNNTDLAQAIEAQRNASMFSPERAA